MAGLWLDRRRTTAVLPLDEAVLLCCAPAGESELAPRSIAEPGAAEDAGRLAGTPRTPMREVIQVMNASGRPVPLVDADNRLVGATDARTC